MQYSMDKRAQIKIGLLSASTMTIMAGAIVAPSLPLIGVAFGDHPGIELLSRLVITLPALFIVFFSSLAGWSIDRFGRRIMMLGSLLFYALAGSTGIYATSIEFLLFGRAMLGIAVAGNMVAITTLIADFFEGHERNRFVGFQGSFMAFGGVVFILAAGWLSDISWQMPFWLYLLSLPVCLLVWKSIPEPQRQGRRYPALSGRRGIHNRRTTYFIYMMGFTGMAMFYIIPSQLPFLLKNSIGASNSMIGYAISISTLSGALISLAYGAIRKRIGFQWIYAIAFGLFSLGYWMISKQTNYFPILLALAISGLGTGLLMPNANLWMLSIAPEMSRGRMVGNLTMAVFMGQFLSPLLLHPLIAVRGIEAAFFYPSVLMLLIAAGFVIERLVSRHTANE